MNSKAFRFNAQNAVEWMGRYSRIPGGLSVFRVAFFQGRDTVLASIQITDGQIVCSAEPSSDLSR